MNAMEKVAWTEIAVSLVAIVCAIATYPWLGNSAIGWFGLLGLVVFGMAFLRKRGDNVLTDERDTAIEKEASDQAVRFVWMTSLLTLVVFVLVFSSRDTSVPTGYLNWLIWIQVALYFLAKGTVAIRAYRGARHAAQG